MYKIASEIKDVFCVFDENNNPILGLTNFSKILIKPDNTIDSTTNITITEIGQGFYSVSFIPNMVGTWLISVKHETFFPAGKASTYDVSNIDCDMIYESLTRLLGLTQENQFIDNTVYNSDGNMTSSRLRLYSNSGSVGTTNDVMATYNITATYSGLNLLTYKVIKS